MLPTRRFLESPVTEVAPRLTRREFLGVGAAAFAATLVPGCGSGPTGPRAGEAARSGRLLAWPEPPTASVSPGLQPLGLSSGRDGLLYVPSGYRPDQPAPLVLMLHGAGGSAQGGLLPFAALADEAGLILLAPSSRGRTWDMLLGAYGPDVEFIDRALAHAFRRCAVDPARLAIEGFSDGASYALSLGLGNGDLFPLVIGFSPGFVAPPAERGTPRFFVSHGTRDPVLPIDVCSRRIVPALERAGYEVHYQEFDGGHAVPAEIAGDAAAWVVAGGAAVAAP